MFVSVHGRKAVDPSSGRLDLFQVGRLYFKAFCQNFITAQTNIFAFFYDCNVSGWKILRKR